MSGRDIFVMLTGGGKSKCSAPLPCHWCLIRFSEAGAVEPWSEVAEVL